MAQELRISTTETIDNVEHNRERTLPDCKTEIKTDIELNNVDNTSDASKPVSTAQQTALDLKIDLTQKGANNGVAELDGSGKLPIDQLPPGIGGGLTWLGLWNASTNTPTITSGVGTNGDTYRVSVAGTTTIDGESDWGVGDWIMFDGTVWQKMDNSDAVTSVFGRNGVVVASTGDYNADQITETATKEFVLPADNTKLGFIAVTQAVDLDTIESDTATNNAKVGITTQQSSDITANNAKVTFPEAPIDGKQYARKDGAWIEVTGGGGGLKTKSGLRAGNTFTGGNPKKSTVTFVGAFADANYSVSVMGQGGDNFAFTIESKLAGSFVISTNSAQAPSNNVLWTAIKHGES